MNHPQRRSNRGQEAAIGVKWLLISLLLLGLLVSCRRAEQIDELPTPTATPVADGLAATPTSTSPELAIREQRPLTVWVPASFLAAPVATSQVITTEARALEDAAVALLADVLARFAQQHPDVHVQVAIKAEEGPASLFNYLRSAQRVAPAILPDLLLMEADQLRPLLELGMLSPLPLAELANPALIYPFARAAATVDEENYGVPYFADLLHLVYNRQLLTEPPASWGALIAMDAQFVYPGADYVAPHEDWVLLEYMRMAAQTTDEITGINIAALDSLFTRLAAARTNGVIAEAVLTISTAEDVWANLATGGAALGTLPAQLFLAQSTPVEEFGFAPLALGDAAPPTFGQVWMFAVPATDPERRTVVLALLNQLLAPAVQAEWSFAAHRLPTRQDALAALPLPATYRDFLHQELQDAQPWPAQQLDDDFVRRLHQTHRALLNGDLTLPEALRAFE